MIKYRLIVQAPEGVWQGEVDSWVSLVILAALSAEPESLDELAEAVRRYQPEHRLFDQPWHAAGSNALVGAKAGGVSPLRRGNGPQT
jgi:hypothetical protein